MWWLLSRASQVAPPSDERKRPEAFDSMKAYTTWVSEGATTTSTRPQEPAGRPLFAAAVSAVQVLPPSALRNRPLPLDVSGPSPPERYVQPLRRKSHIPA